MKDLLKESYDAFQEFCHKLIDYKDNLNVQFECWLIALGKSDELKKMERKFESIICGTKNNFINDLLQKYLMFFNRTQHIMKRILYSV